MHELLRVPRRLLEGADGERYEILLGRARAGSGQYPDVNRPQRLSCYSFSYTSGVTLVRSVLWLQPVSTESLVGRGSGQGGGRREEGGRKG
eukprot:1791141-Rhodomonas_salina.2